MFVEGRKGNLVVVVIEGKKGAQNGSMVTGARMMLKLCGKSFIFVVMEKGYTMLTIAQKFRLFDQVEK